MRPATEVFAQLGLDRSGAQRTRAVLAQLGGVEFGQQHAHGQARIALYRQARAEVAVQLLSVDIDTNQFAAELEVAIEDHVVIGFTQLGADRQHHVGFQR